MNQTICGHLSQASFTQHNDAKVGSTRCSMDHYFIPTYFLFLIIILIIYFWLCWVCADVQAFLYLYSRTCSLVAVCGLPIVLASSSRQNRLEGMWAAVAAVPGH